MSDDGRGVLERLDHLSGAQAGALGLAAGLSGMGLLAAPGWARLAVGAGALGGAALLAKSAGWIERRKALVPDAVRDVLDMVSIPAGRFMMGSPDSDDMAYDGERPAFEVEMPSTRWMQRCTVTNAEYRRFRPEHQLDEADELPVTWVSWFDAVAFCNAMSIEAGYEPVYAIDGKTVTWTDGEGYRLPTESEWEYACRAGTTTRFSFDDDGRALGKHAWFDENSDIEAHPVGQKRANPLGLHDMHGNVLEWCWSAYSSYPRPQVKVGHASDNARALRGGAFVDWAGYLRSAYRYWDGPGVRLRFIGFRCVRGPRPER